MPTISGENAKTIRTPFAIRCGIKRVGNEELTFNVGSSYLHKTIQTDTELTQLADLSEDGFPLDGSCVSYDPDTMDDGIGVRSHIGQGFIIRIRSATVIQGVTIIGTGTGTVTDGTTTLDWDGETVFPMGVRDIYLTFTNSDPDARIEIQSIQPGIDLEFTNEDLISCVLALRSDLSACNQQWQVSEIEIQAHYTDDVPAMLATVGDGQKIYYRAGYGGDWSPTRYFYLSEAITLQDNIITIKGEDASAKLEKATNTAFFGMAENATLKKMYRYMYDVIKGCGIAMKKANFEVAPATVGSETTKHYILAQASTGKDVVAAIMDLGHTAVSGRNFWPTFVDAGIPKLSHSKPTARWTIREEDCCDIVRITDRKIRTVTPTGSDYGLTSSVSLASKRTTAGEFSDCKKGKSTVKNPDGFYHNMEVSPGKITFQTPDKVIFTPGQFYTTKKVVEYTKVNGKKKKVTAEKKVKTDKGTVTVKGYAITPSRLTKSQSAAQIGIKQEVKVPCYGQAKIGSTVVYPNFGNLFSRSSISGSFKWKGDPRMQPRDVFSFVRLDGTAETCTIETITLTHEGGGTMAEITYRLGVV